MAGAVISDYELQLRLNAVRTRWNTLSTLRLFKNNFVPVPATALGAFVECNFDTYAPHVLTGTWTAISMVMSGQWQMLTGVYVYGTPVSTGNTVYGYYVDDGTGVLQSQLFPVPIVFNVGAPPFALQVQDRESSESLF
jgi:hypothetical protein